MRRAGAVTTVAAIFNVEYQLALAALAAWGEPTPVLATPLYLVPAAMALAGDGCLVLCAAALPLAPWLQAP